MGSGLPVTTGSRVIGPRPRCSRGAIGSLHMVARSRPVGSGAPCGNGSGGRRSTAGASTVWSGTFRLRGTGLGCQHAPIGSPEASTAFMESCVLRSGASGRGMPRGGGPRPFSSTASAPRVSGSVGLVRRRSRNPILISSAPTDCSISESGFRRERRVSTPRPALWSAVAANDWSRVRELVLEGSVDIDQRYQGWTPLMKAAELGATRIVDFLLEQGAELEAVNKRGRSALSFAAAPSSDGRIKRQASVEVIECLLGWGADMNMRDGRGYTAKELALHERRGEVVALFERYEREHPRVSGALGDVA